MIPLVVGKDVLPLFYQVSAGLHCVGLNIPVPSTDQHLEGGLVSQATPFACETRGRVWVGKEGVCKDAVLYGH